MWATILNDIFVSIQWWNRNSIRMGLWKLQKKEGVIILSFFLFIRDYYLGGNTFFWFCVNFKWKYCIEKRRVLSANYWWTRKSQNEVKTNNVFGEQLVVQLYFVESTSAKRCFHRRYNLWRLINLVFYCELS